ncbi:phosphatidylinositol-glycan biosynthesis class W protein [Ixodes scapularis]
MGREERLAHESFVTNKEGGFPEEIVMISCIPMLSASLHGFLCRTSFVASLRRNLWSATALDILLQCVPLILAVTVLSSYVACITFSMLAASLGARVVHHLLQQRPPRTQKAQRNRKAPGKKGPPSTGASVRPAWSSVVTAARSQVLLGAAVFILAVDFPAFARRLAKTKRSGFSLMDTGVGLFVALAAASSPEAKGAPSPGGVQNVVRAVKGSVPLVLIGLSRVVAVKNLEYQSPISEYGVHWNFFFTLAFTKVAASVVYAVLPARLDWLVGSILAVGYEAVLQLTQLSAFLDNSNRDGLVAANKEGLASLAGFLALYLIVVALSRRLLYGARSCIRDWVAMVFEISAVALVGLALTYVMHSDLAPVSRRLANLPYCLWTMCLFLVTIVCFVLLQIADVLLCQEGMQVDFSQLQVLHKAKDAAGESQEPNLLWYSINFNAMPMFLLVNLLTGLVNIVLRPRTMGTLSAVLVLVVYISVAAFTTVFLYSRKMKLKLPFT